MQCIGKSAFRIAPAFVLWLLFSFWSSAETFSLSEDIVLLCEQCETEDISSALIQSVIWFESRGVSDAVSADGKNIGLMQLHISYFEGDLTDPLNNIRQGAEYLQQLYDSSQVMEIALMQYHGENDPKGKYEAGNVSQYANQIMELKNQIESEDDEMQEDLEQEVIDLTEKLKEVNAEKCRLEFENEILLDRTAEAIQYVLEKNLKEFTKEVLLAAGFSVDDVDVMLGKKRREDEENE